MLLNMALFSMIFLIGVILFMKDSPLKRYKIAGAAMGTVSWMEMLQLVI